MTSFILINGKLHAAVECQRCHTKYWHRTKRGQKQWLKYHLEHHDELDAAQGRIRWTERDEVAARRYYRRRTNYHHEEKHDGILNRRPKRSAE